MFEKVQKGKREGGNIPKGKHSAEGKKEKGGREGGGDFSKRMKDVYTYMSYIHIYVYVCICLCKRKGEKEGCRMALA